MGAEWTGPRTATLNDGRDMIRFPSAYGTASALLLMACGALAFAAAPASAQEAYDIVIAGGRVMDP